jgi:hypothetical protein
MKHLTRILAVSFSISTAATIAHAAPFLAVGDGAEVFFTGVVGVRNDSNIFLSANGAKSDTIFNLTPGLQLTFGNASELKGSLSAVESLDYYASNSNLNTHLFSGDFVSNYDDDKSKFNLDTYYHELNQNDVNIRGLARRNEFNFTTGGELDVSEKEAVGASFQVDNVDFLAKGYSSDTMYSIPLNVYYHWTPKVDLSVGYRYRNISESIGQDSDDNYFNVGARGEFTPKLTGSFDVGLEDVTYKANNTLPKSTGDNVGFDTNLTYAYTPKTTLILTGSNSYTADAFGDREKSFSVGLHGQTQFMDELTGIAGISFQHNEYALRTDKYYDLQVGANYTLNTHVNFVAGFDYRTNESTDSGAKFSDNLFSVSANLRY